MLKKRRSYYSPTSGATGDANGAAGDTGRASLFVCTCVDNKTASNDALGSGQVQVGHVLVIVSDAGLVSNGIWEVTEHGCAHDMLPIANVVAGS